MPATRNRPPTRPEKPFGTSLAIAIATVAVLAGFIGCRSPLGGQAALKADLSLSFIVSGAERLARDAAALRILSDVPGTSARLLLPTADSLEVTLTPEAGGEAISAEPAQIVADKATVPVSLSSVPYGRYIVKAEAKDATGGVRFTQTSPLAVGDPEMIVTLNLVPTDAAGGALTATTLHDIDDTVIAHGEARTWLVAPGSRLLAARSIFLSGLGSEARVYLQTSDGTLISDPLGTGTHLSTVGLPAGEPAYLTVYNGSAEASITSRAFPGPAMVEVPGGLESSTSAPVVPFLMGATEVTQEQFQHIMGFNYSDAGSINGEIPIGNVTMYDAMNFCNALSALEGLEPVYSLTEITMFNMPYEQSVQSANYTADFSKNGYRLPTLSERIWATRGGSTTLYYWGDALEGADQYAWHASNSENQFQPVAGKLPNGYGLYDITGNVYEWCWGSDDQAQANPSRCGGTVRVAVDGYQEVTARWEVGADQGGGNGYVDNGFRVVLNGIKEPVQVKHYAYVTNRGINSVSAYNMHLDGTLSLINTYPTGEGPSFVQKSPDGKFLYIANYNSSTISVYSVNADGSLTIIGSPVPTEASYPQQIAINPAGTYLYVTNVSGTESYKLSAFSIGSDGTLTALSGSPYWMTSPTALMVDPSGQYLLATGFPDGSTYGYGAYSIAGTTGAITATPVSYLTIAGANGNSIAMNGSNHVYVGTASGFIAAAVINDDGMLTYVGGYSHLDQGGFVNSLAVHPAGTYLFSANSGGSTPNITAFSIDSGTGALTGLSNYLGAGCLTPSAVVVDASGKYLYVTNSGSNNITIFRIEASGSLTEITNVTTGLKPGSIALIRKVIIEN